jgi:hypothetical protein
LQNILEIRLKRDEDFSNEVVTVRSIINLKVFYCAEKLEEEGDIISLYSCPANQAKKFLIRCNDWMILTLNEIVRCNIRDCPLQQM